MGNGGMRHGAGRPGWHVKAEHCRHIDARRWAREGILQSHCSGAWAWTDPETGERLASIGYQCDTRAVTLSFNLNGQPMSQRLPILASGCHYGGRRLWFGCPFCARRVAILYLRASGFACRQCNRIAYSSQSEDAMGRAWRKQSKAEAKLGEGWSRPKGMHHTTRERLMSIIMECERARDDALMAFLTRMGWPLRGRGGGAKSLGRP